jgi:hypothetical protein
MRLEKNGTSVLAFSFDDPPAVWALKNVLSISGNTMWMAHHRRPAL